MKQLSMALLAFCMVMTWSTSAQAKKGLLFINWGEDIFEAGELPEELQAEAPGWKVGYKCSIVGLLWAYFHTWDCEPVAFQGDTYDDSPEVKEVIAAMGITKDDMKMNAWSKHGRWLFLGGLIFVGVGAIRKSRDDDDDE